MVRSASPAARESSALGPTTWNVRSMEAAISSPLSGSERITPRISSAFPAVLAESSRICVATTAKDLPCSPAPAAMMEALRERRLVCSVTSWMTSTIFRYARWRSRRSPRAARLCSVALRRAEDLLLHRGHGGEARLGVLGDLAGSLGEGLGVSAGLLEGGVQLGEEGDRLLARLVEALRGAAHLLGAGGDLVGGATRSSPPTG